MKSTDIDRLAKRGEVVVPSNSTCQSSEITRSGGTLIVSFSVNAPSSEDYVEVPISWYPHYEATIDGKEVKNEPGDNNVIRVYTEGRHSGTIRVKWKAPIFYRILECISLLVAVGYPLNRKYDFSGRLFQKRRHRKV